MWSPFTLDLTICLASQSQLRFFIVLTPLTSRPIAMGLDMLLPWHETTPTQMVANLSVFLFSLLPLFPPCSFSFNIYLYHLSIHQSTNKSCLLSIIYLPSICLSAVISSIIYPNCHYQLSIRKLSVGDYLFTFFTALVLSNFSVSWSEKIPIPTCTQTIHHRHKYNTNNNNKTFSLPW